MQVEKLRFSSKSAQEALDIGATKFWDLVKTGKLRIHHDGKRAFVTSDELKRYLASCEAQSPTTSSR
jgi:hypothetical protein